MSKNFAVLEKAGPERTLHSSTVDSESVPQPGNYAGLIRRLFCTPSVITVIGKCSDHSAAGICHEIAGELAASGKRVVVVPVDKLLRISPIPVPDATSFVPGNAPNVSVWPSSVGQQIEFFKSRTRPETGYWLDSLRLNFDSVLLDCTLVEIGSGGAEVAAMADGAVLAVEAGRTTKQQIKNEQRALQLRGARLAGCILIRRR